MMTLIERLATEPKHDPAILLPNVWHDLLRTVETLCPCGSTTSVRNGALAVHEPKSVWTADGKRRAAISDAYGIGWTCRYSGRTVTLAAALERDNALSPTEKRVRDTTLSRLGAGIRDTAPEGYALPRPVADLFSAAEAGGWTTQQAWAPHGDGFNLSIRVSRPAAGFGDRWQYDVTYFVAPDVARRTRGGLCRTPEQRDLHDSPSIKAITTVIRSNPVTAEG